MYNGTREVSKVAKSSRYFSISGLVELTLFVKE